MDTINLARRGHNAPSTERDTISDRPNPNRIYHRFYQRAEGVSRKGFMKGKTAESRRLLAEMMRAGVTVNELAEALGVSYSHLCAVVHGRYDSKTLFDRAWDYVRRMSGEEGDGRGPDEGPRADT